MVVDVVPKVLPEGSSVYTFKVTLKNVRPLVWRRIEVPGSFNFAQLSRTILIAMGWRGYHLHEFTGLVRVVMKAPDGDDYEAYPGEPEGVRETKIRVDRIFTADMKTLNYEYDFGDGWEHKVLLEKITPGQEGKMYPTCIKGKNACPPEDCGGSWGYADLLKQLRDPQDPEHQEMKDWLQSCGYGQNFDPTRFDPSQVSFGAADSASQ